MACIKVMTKSCASCRSAKTCLRNGTSSIRINVSPRTLIMVRRILSSISSPNAGCARNGNVNCLSKITIKNYSISLSRHINGPDVITNIGRCNSRPSTSNFMRIITIPPISVYGCCTRTIKIKCLGDSTRFFEYCCNPRSRIPRIIRHYIASIRCTVCKISCLVPLIIPVVGSSRAIHSAENKVCPITIRYCNHVII